MHTVPLYSQFKLEAVSVLGSCLLILAALYRSRRSEQRLPSPPGPRPLPFLGNILDLPTHSPWLQFSEWNSKHGDLIHIKLVGTDVVIVNSAEKATRLLNRSACSDRPRFVMAGEIMGYVRSMALAPFGDHWKSMRRLTQQGFSKTSIQRILPHQLEGSRRFLASLVSKPRDYLESLRFLLGKTILETTYGLEVDSVDSKLIRVSEAIQSDISFAIVPGNFLVDTFPSLKRLPWWLPGLRFDKYSERARQLTEQMVYEPFEEVKDRMFDGTCPPCLVSSVLEDSALQEKTPNFEYVLKWAAGTLYGAGTETSVACFSVFALAMALYPEVQRRAQEELDRVVGMDRLPTFDDRQNLPYIDAIVKEALRWQPPVPLGVPHRVMEEQVFDGYRIPKGTIVLSNIWQMGKDASVYSDPFTFKPERFLPQYSGGEAELDPSTYVFGFGRRACPGNHYATSSLFIQFASVLAAFSIRAEDGEKYPVTIKPEFTQGFVSHAMPFPCKFTPRTRAMADIIRLAQ